MRIESNEQWKTNGKCHVCRRKNYCTNQCKAAKKRAQYELQCRVSQAMFKKIWEMKDDKFDDD